MNRGTLERVEMCGIWAMAAHNFAPYLEYEAKLQILDKNVGMGIELEAGE